MKLHILGRYAIKTRPYHLRPHSWNTMSELSSVVIYFEPSDECHTFVGDKLLQGSGIKFIPFTSTLTIPEGDSCLLLTSYTPYVLVQNTNRIVSPEEDHETNQNTCE